MPTEIMFTGRLVGGHPMVTNQKKDDNDKPLLNDDGTPRTSTFLALAIPKVGTVVQWRPVGTAEWQQTPNWREIFEREAREGWNLGEWQHPTFAWKIIDGDSTVPMKPFRGKPGRIPVQSEGYPGHWVISCSTEWGVKCYHVGKYDPHLQIQNKDEIKCGDYCRILVSVKANKPAKSPGLYVNPVLFELSRAGQRIVTGDGPDAATAFGGSAPVLPANGAYDTAVAPPPVSPGVPPVSPGVPPAPVEPKYLVNGVEYTLSALKAAGWTDAQIATATPVGAPPAVVAPPVVAPPTAPAPDFLTPPVAPVVPPEEQYFIEGKVYTRSQLVGFGWTPAQIAGAAVYTGSDVLF